MTAATIECDRITIAELEAQLADPLPARELMGGKGGGCGRGHCKHAIEVNLLCIIKIGLL